MREKNRPEHEPEKTKEPFSSPATGIINRIRSQFHDCPDFILKKAILSNGQTGYYLFLETLADPQEVNEKLIQPLLGPTPGSATGLNQIRSIATPINDPEGDTIANLILSGAVILILEEEEKRILSIRLRPIAKSFPEPETEKILHGPHEGFSADLQKNLTLLRSKLVSNRLKFKCLKVGSLNPKKIVIAYCEGLAQPQLLERLITKINGLKLDKPTGAGQLETLIKDFPRSLFPQFQVTARPDQAINSLLGGKFLILIENTPVTLSAPVNFFTFFEKPDDLNYNWLFRPFIRLLRLIAAGLAVFLPALYIAVISFHLYIIPVNFLIPLAESRTQVPFPPIIEILFLEIIVELLRESVSRFASHLGASIGIVSGILLGLAAISTGMVSAVTVAVSMVTLIASLTMPPYDLGLSVRILKFIALLLASLFGVLGLIVTTSVTFAHLITLESLGQPYFQPLIPAAYDSLQRYFPIKNQKLVYGLYTGLTILLSRLPKDLIQAVQLAQIVNLAGIGVFGFLILCYLYSLINQRGVKSK